MSAVLTRSPARWEVVLAVAALALGVLALSVAGGQRLAAEVTLAQARADERSAAQDLAAATGSLTAATERRDAAAAASASAQREAAGVAEELTGLRQTVRETDYPARLALAEQLVGLGGQQADRFSAMNDAALADDATTYNRLAEDSNTFIQQNNDLWGQLTDTSGIDPDAPLV